MQEKKGETHEETKSTEETVRIDKQGKTKKRNPRTEWEQKDKECFSIL